MSDTVALIGGREMYLALKGLGLAPDQCRTLAIRVGVGVDELATVTYECLLTPEGLQAALAAIVDVAGKDTDE